MKLLSANGCRGGAGRRTGDLLLLGQLAPRALLLLLEGRVLLVQDVLEGPVREGGVQTVPVERTGHVHRRRRLCGRRGSRQISVFSARIKYMH